MPLIEAAHRAFGAAVDVWAIGQDAAGNAKLVERYALTVPMLDDSALKVSFDYGLDTVPTIILADVDGHEARRFVGFGRDDWREMFAELARQSGVAAPPIDWNSYPESRPGCGSKSVEPGIAERLEAEARGDKMTARRIELGDAEDVFEFMFERGLTDGLPVVPPTPERVMWMLTGTRRDPREVVAIVPPNLAPVTVEKVAVNAVMAGCKPEYLPVVIAALEAVCTDTFNIHGIMSTTWGATPVIVVNGPIRRRLDMNMGMMALGYGTRSNATIGRALKLVLRNVGGARPGDIERSTLGAPGKFTTCFAEWEERSPWEPLHVERGFGKDENVVTVFGLEAGSRQIADQTSRTARALARQPRHGARSMLASQAARQRRDPAHHFARACRHSRPREVDQGAGARANPGSYRTAGARIDSRRRERRRNSAERTRRCAGSAARREDCEVSPAGGYQYHRGWRQRREIFRGVRRMGFGSDGIVERQPANRGGNGNMKQVIIDPTDERVPIRRTLAARSDSIVGRVALLDIAKPRGNVLLDRLAEHLQDRLPGVEIKRFRKPTFTKPAPDDLRRRIAEESDFVIEALAD